MRIFYASGPGDAISAHKSWAAKLPAPEQMEVTYSSQVADFCAEIGADVFIISSSSKGGRLEDGKFYLEQVPKIALNFYLSQVLYALVLLVKAVRFRADIAIIHSDATHFFMLSLFPLFGINVVPVLHNTIWPAGFPKAGKIQRLVRFLDGLFFRWFEPTTLGVSSECLKQVSELSKTPDIRLIEFKAQFKKSYFEDIPPPPRWIQPFQIMFSGRIARNKGVFDAIMIAYEVERQEPDRVDWVICGDGPDMEELKRFAKGTGLTNIKILGHIFPDKMKTVLAESHAVIVPTRSDFPEGLAKSAVEAILAGRPVITSSVNPALALLRPACIEAETDSVTSYTQRILEMLHSPTIYETLRQSCPQLREPFYDRRNGLAAALRVALEIDGTKFIMPPSPATSDHCRSTPDQDHA